MIKVIKRKEHFTLSELSFDDAVRQTKKLLTYDNNVSSDVSSAVISRLEDALTEQKRLKQKLAETLEDNKLTNDLYARCHQCSLSYLSDNARMHDLLATVRDKYNISELTDLNDHFENNYQDDSDMFIDEN